MNTKIFTKRHGEAAKEVFLTQAVRRRIWNVMEELDPFYDPQDINNNWSLAWDALPDRLKKEHGWEELRAYKTPSDYEVLKNCKEFIQHGVPRFVFDAAELFYDLLCKNIERCSQLNGPPAEPAKYQAQLNVVFDDANLPWRMLDGRITRLDSKWVETEIHAKAAELLSMRGFEGALAEFQQARFDLSSGDCKGAIHAANLALESTMKVIVGVEREKTGVLIRKLIESEIVPDYHEGFLKAFEEHILRSVPIARNFEKGVGHGQGSEVNEPPKSLAELAINLSGVLILYLIKRHLEYNTGQSELETVPEIHKAAGGPQPKSPGRR